MTLKNSTAKFKMRMPKAANYLHCTEVSFGHLVRVMIEDLACRRRSGDSEEVHDMVKKLEGPLEKKETKEVHL